METGPGNSPIGKDQQRCTECLKSYRNCDCKSCSKCGCVFRKYAGTGLIKGRSHCRSCGSAVCLTCHIIVQNKKICTRCHLRQKEDELSTERAIIAIEEAKYGKSDAMTDEKPLYSRLMHGEKKETVLFEAAKNGNDHVLVIALNMGADVNCLDNNKNTPLFHAAEGGRLACCALLLDRKAEVNVVNNSSWTPLHAVAWKGCSDSHVECADLLLEAGANSLAETLTNETAADLAERCGGKLEIIEMLRAAEVETAVIRLRERIKALQGLNSKERKLWRMITCLLNYVCKAQRNEAESVSESKLKDRLSLPSEAILRCRSLDRTIDTKTQCEKCGANAVTAKKQNNQSLDSVRPTADVEPMLRERLIKLEADKKDWEQRCRKLMQSVATNSKEHLRAMELAKEEIIRLKEEKDVELRKCDAAHANKLAKVRQEADSTIWDYHNQLEESESAKEELLHLQKTHKLTWVPDNFVKSCQNSKCRAPFSQSAFSRIPPLGYELKVRVCRTCFALVEDYLGEVGDGKSEELL
eukprot:gene404-1039_t